MITLSLRWNDYILAYSFIFAQPLRKGLVKNQYYIFGKSHVSKLIESNNRFFNIQCKSSPWIVDFLLISITFGIFILNI